MNVVMSIAGSDPTAGAGIQADLKTFLTLGVYGTTVITSVTSQNTQQVYEIFDLPLKLIESQFEAVLADFQVDAVKIGMLSNENIISLVINLLNKYNLEKVILDPVMVSSSGKKLLSDKGIELLKELAKSSFLVTPNKSEMEILCNFKFEEIKSNDLLQSYIENSGMKNVLIKGGHFSDTFSTDLLYTDGKFLEFTSDRYEISSIHGTGCTLSSAITVYIAKGFDITTAVRYAKEYISGAIKNSKKLDNRNRQNLINHLYNLSNH